MNKILSGKEVAQALKDKIKKHSDLLAKKDIYPTLCIIRVGSKQEDLSYERGILNNCKAVGVAAKVVELPEDVNMDDFTNTLKHANKNSDIHGILIFRPLPSQIDEDVVKYLIHPDKDIDCMNPINLGKLFAGESDVHAPCTPAAVMEILKYYNIDLSGMEAVVIGRSNVVGRPLSMMLLKENATVTICHSKTKDLPAVTSRADIIIPAMGKAKVIDRKYITPNDIIIDVGINVDEEGKLCGDVDFEDVADKAGAITPVPGGVGAVTTSILLWHVVQAAEKLSGILLEE